MPDSYKLVPLRIPTGWAVTFNNFWEIEPLIKNGEFVNADDFTLDLLVVERIVPPGTSWPPYILDLGWYPEAVPSGHYRLVLRRRDAEGTLKTVESPNRGEIRETIDRWLNVLNAPELIGRNPSPYL